MGTSLVTHVHAHQEAVQSLVWTPDQTISHHTGTVKPGGSLHWQGQLCIEFVSWQTDVALRSTYKHLQYTSNSQLHHSAYGAPKASQAIGTYEKPLLLRSRNGVQGAAQDACCNMTS